jgi:hypothetical protein
MSLRTDSYSLLVIVASAHNFKESILKRSATNEETINIRLLDQFIGVFVSNGATVQNASVISSSFRDVALDPATDEIVCLLCFFR